MELNEQEEKPIDARELTAELPKKQPLKTAIVSVLILGLLAGLAYAGFDYYQIKKNTRQVADVTKLPANDLGSTVIEPTPTASTTNEPYDPFVGQQCQNRLPTLTSKSGVVTWQDPVKVAGMKIFAPGSEPYSSYQNDISYKVGTINSGKYAGGEFILTYAIPDGPSAAEMYRIIKLKDRLYFLNQYSSSYPDGLTDAQFINKPIQDKTFTLEDLKLPTTIHTASPLVDFTYAKSLGFFQNGTEYFCADHLVKVFTDSIVGDVYTDPDAKTVAQISEETTKLLQAGKQPADYRPLYGFYIKAPDGTKRVYNLDISFIGQDKIALLNWSNNKKNTAEYSYQAVGGCGSTKFLDVADVNDKDLTQIGTTFSGQAVYGYKDTNTQELQDAYSNIYVAEGKTKPTFSAFLTSHPIFFWKNPFGYYVRFKNQAYQPLAECAKPIIYLYPEKTTNVSVKVNPLGGLLYSDPDYGNGWSVIASPTGKLTNKTDGKTYPYLFWEGRGGLYVPPTRGFMVERDGLDAFLTEKLRLLGLHDTETRDFKEYWLPKMQAKPYYFVSFMTNSIVDDLAPLTVTPKPDTIIRILMDFTPLDKPISVQGFNIQTPVRKGFTVVEWGGVLR